MNLVVTATPVEMKSLQQVCPQHSQFLVSGVGLVETTFNLTRYLLNHPEVTRVLHLGIAGGFPSSNLAVLDGCLASSETIADLGICYDTHIEGLDPDLLTLANFYPCENTLHHEFLEWSNRSGYDFHCGPFLSVNGVSGSTLRGEMINHSQCICENMEGAGVARTCLGLDIEWLEFRVISNLVEDRDLRKWQIQPAIAKYTEIIAAFLKDVSA